MAKYVDADHLVHILRQELGDEMAIYFLNRIQVAKMKNDMEELRKIRQEISAALRGEQVAINDKR